MQENKPHFFKDMSIMLGRSMKHILRSMDTIITVCVTPIAIMILFVYVFGGAMSGGMSTKEYIAYALPGILLISIASAIGYTAMRLFMDVKSGFFDRIHTMPVSSSSALWVHVITSLISTGVSLILIILVACLMGFRSPAGIMNWLGVIGILVLFTLALTWVAAIAGCKVKSVEGSYSFSYPLVFLPFISSAFLPTETMPSFVRVFAQHQPVTAIVDSIRSLLTNQPVGNELLIALAWCIGILLIAWILAIKTFKNHE